MKSFCLNKKALFFVAILSCLFVASGEAMAGERAEEWAPGVLNCFVPQDKSGAKQLAVVLSLPGNEGDGLDARIFEVCEELRIPVMVMVSGEWLGKHTESYGDYLQRLKTQGLASFGTHGAARCCCLLAAERLEVYEGLEVPGDEGQLGKNVLDGEAALQTRGIADKDGRIFYMPVGCLYSEVGVGAFKSTVGEEGTFPIGFSLRGDAAGFYDVSKIKAQLLRKARSGDIVLYNAARPHGKYGHAGWGAHVAQALREAAAAGIVFVQLADQELASDGERVAD